MSPGHPAGLSSTEAHLAVERWDPIKGSLTWEAPESTRHVHPTPQLPAPAHVSSNYTNEDIPFSHPSGRPLLATSGLPRTFKAGARCVNPLEPRYVLPGTSALAREAQSGGGAVSSPKAAALPSPGGGGGGGLGGDAAAGLPTSPIKQSSSQRLLLPLIGSRGGDGSGCASPKLQPITSPSATLTAAAAAAATALQPAPPNPAIATNGAVGGLLLYGPASGVGPAAAAVLAAAAGNRCLNVDDINGPRRSSSVPPRRTGGYDPLYVTDIVPPRKASPPRALTSLTTGDIRGATVKARTRDVPSPGRGTLSSSDIAGSQPGCLTRASPSTYALGRWPAPAVPTYQFNQASRVTVLRKPLTIGE